MYRHVVMWKFREGTEQDALKFVEALNALYGVIPELRHAEARLNANPDNGLTGVLISDFDDRAAMERYKADPRHAAVSSMCKAIRVSREAADFEL